jgi:hypothetical protein
MFQPSLKLSTSFRRCFGVVKTMTIAAQMMNAGMQARRISVSFIVVLR